MRKSRSWRIRLGVLAVALSAVVLAAGASAVTTVTVGQTVATGGNGCLFTNAGVGFVNAQVGNPTYTVPDGVWQVVSWSTGASTSTTSNPASMTGMSLLMLRPTATADAFTVVGVTQTQVLSTTAGIETFTADPPLVTQGGDILAFWGTGLVSNSRMRNCFFGSTPDGDLLTGASSPLPAAGTEITLPDSIPLPPPPRPGHPLINVSATLAPLGMTDCKGGGWQDFGVFKNQGDCVSYVATGGGNQPAG
jgi:hypothetical protein